MNGRTIRARVLLEEALVLGLDLADLIAAGASRLPTVGPYIETVAPTFTAATAATYRPYWRLTAAHLGDRRLTDITVEDLLAVVDAAATQCHRPPGLRRRVGAAVLRAAVRAVDGLPAVPARRHP